MQGEFKPFFFYFLFTKICVSKNPSLQTPGTLDILATLQWHFLFHRHWTPNESADSSNFLFLFNFLLLHLQLLLRLPSFSSVRCFLRVAAQNEVDSWIQGAACCSEGGDLLVGQSRGCPDLDAEVLSKGEVH